MKVYAKFTISVIGFAFYVYMSCYFLLSNPSIVPYDIKPCMGKAQFYFSYVCYPYDLVNYGAFTVKGTEFYYYLFYPIDILI